MLVGVGSLRGAPGASCIAVAMTATWERRERTILAELDPDGGTFAARYGLAIEEVNLAGLAAASRHRVDEEAVWRHTQESPFGFPMIVAPSTPSEMTRVMSGFARRVEELGSTLGDTGVDVFCDLGRIRPDSQAAEVATAMDVIVLVLRPTFDQLEPLLRRLPELLTLAPIAVVLAGEGPYRATDVDLELREQSVGRAWVLGEVPYDRRGAKMISAQGSGSRRLHRSALWRAARKLSSSLAASTDDDSVIVAPERTAEADLNDEVLDLTDDADDVGTGDEELSA